jgi:hypothetical protein
VKEGTIQYYLAQIAQYDREFKDWNGRVEKILKRYRDDDKSTRNREDSRFNVLWSNVQTLKAATLAGLPRPDVSRRFKDSDPVGRVASLILERALDFEIQYYADFNQSLRDCVYDRFLGGRGTAWVRYEPVFKPNPFAGMVTEDENAEAPESEVLDYECAPTDYVHWRDFGHSVARTWEEVPIVWRKVYMGQDAIKERFPDFADQIPIDSSPQDKGSETDPDGVGKKALIYEVWDKDAGKAVWISKSVEEFLDEKEDPLELDGFFPCPRPLFSTLTTDSLVPIPDYTLYQSQAIQLDILSDRIDGLIESLKVFGVHDASIPELARLFKEGGNTELLPVKNWAAFAEKSGLKGSIELVDIAPLAQALGDAYNAFEQIKKQIYELTGIADIQRGNTMASETATAQQIKNQYATLRLKVYQDEVAVFATGLLRRKAEVICRQFDPQTILQMGSAQQLSQYDQQYIVPAIQMLKSETLRNFRIEVASDSLVYLDEQQEKQDRLQFLQATSQFIGQLMQAAQQAPEIMTLGAEMLKFGVSGFRVGRTLEGVIDEAADKAKQMAMQPKPTPPNPEMIKAQAEQQSQQMAQQHEIQLTQFKEQLETQRIQTQNQVEAQRQSFEAQVEAQKQQHEAVLAAQQLQSQQSFDRWKAELDAATKVLIAQIAASGPVSPSVEEGAESEFSRNIGGLAMMHSQTLEAIRRLTP